jgi:hypothetical protein
MASRLHWFAIASVLVLTVAPAAHAAGPSAQEKETARAMMDEGHARRAAGDHKAALAQFQGADAIMHVPTTGLEVAREQVALGLLVEARDTLNALRRRPPAADEPEVFRAAREAALALDHELATQIASLKVTLAGAKDVETVVVAIDALHVPPAALVSPFKVDPGHHVITATTSGGTAREEIDVRPGQEASVMLTVVPGAPLPTPPSSPSSPSGVGAESAAASTPGFVPWLRWGGFGLAAAGLAVGAIEGIRSMSLTNTARNACNGDMCPPGTWNDIDSARSAAMISNVSFAVAGGGAALGLLSFVFRGESAPRKRAETTTTRPVSLWIGLGMAGIEGTLE